MKFVALLITFTFFLHGFSQILRIKGNAPAYVGESIELYAIEDYFSMKESLLARTEVKEDSTFSLTAELKETQKLILRSNNNESFIYAQPDATYKVFFPDRDKYDPYRPNGNQVELAFYELDSTDINYKILSFERWVDNFIGNYYYLKNAKPMEFVAALDRFKGNVEKAYQNDTSTYFKTFVRFSMASLENIQHAAERNRYEKHDFYIKFSPVAYRNDAYMNYIRDFYQNLMPRLSNKTNEQVYDGILHSSPTMIMNALGTEYTLINVRIREMIMAKALSEVFHSGDYPQTNILTILDSVENQSLFAANGLIAKNLKDRLTELVPGGKAPNLFLSDGSGTNKTLMDYKGKHLYIHFFDPSSLENRKDLGLLKEMYKRYNNYVQFVTVYPNDKTVDEESAKELESITWDVYGLSDENSIWKNYRVKTFPQYVLIDAAGYIVQSPALAPTPNGQYQTIDLTFYNIQQLWLQNNPDEGEPYDRNH
jgi:hypothetical protein